MRQWRWLVLGLSIIMILSAVIILQKPMQPTQKKSQMKPMDPAHIRINDVSLSLVDQQDVVRWKLKIKEAKESSDGMTIYKVYGEYYPDQGEPFTMTAQTGQINKEMNELVLSPDVTLTQADYILNGHQLVWNAKDKGFQMIGGVILDSSTIHGEGERLVTDASLKKVRFEGQCLWRSKTNLPKGGQKH